MVQDKFLKSLNTTDNKELKLFLIKKYLSIYKYLICNKGLYLLCLNENNLYAISIKLGKYLLEKDPYIGIWEYLYDFVKISENTNHKFLKYINKQND